MWPLYKSENLQQRTHITLGTQPLAVHLEGLLAGRVFARNFRRWSCAWAVNSRYAGALMASGIPYAIWEATTIRDELAVVDIQAIRAAGLGTGIGAMLHRAFLPLGDRLEGMLYRKATVLAAMSDYTRRRMIEIHGLTDRAVRVLHHPPTPAFLAALAEERSRSIGPRASGTDVRLLAVGRMDDPRKNFRLLLEAYRLVRDTVQPVMLTILGPHSSRWRESLNVRPEEGITFLGEVSLSVLTRAYLDHDLLVVPSKQEGFGIVVAEALHAGLPVVSTRCGGPEQVLRDSGGGVLTEMTAEAFATSIIELMRDPARREHMARSGRDYALKVLSFDSFRVDVAEMTRSMLQS
ncbi:MAG: glycosyltransferase family 4 protein [Gemmatimonadaceae bacterium]